MKNNRRRYSDLYPSCFLKKALFLTALFFLTNTVSATTYYADVSRSDDSGAGTSWATAKHTIQAAVDLASDGDTVWMTNGTYSSGGAADGRIRITKNITVQSVNGPDVTIIDGGGSLRCASLTHGVLSGVTLMSGNVAEGSGGGAYLNGGGTLNNCLLKKNTASDGGGVYLYSGGILNNCMLSENKVTGLGGGAYLQNGGILNNCIIWGNEADSPEEVASMFKPGSGGGVILQFGGVLNNCTLSENTATGIGGGVLFDAGGVVYNSIIWGNLVTDNENDLYGNEVFYYDSGYASYTCTSNPLFVDAKNGDFRLQPNSPCINVGHNSYAPAGMDLRGYARIIDGTVDMGAYETDYVFADASRDDDSGDGRSWGAAKKTIQAAVDLAEDGGIISVQSGIYNAGGAVVPGYLSTNRVCITNAITVQSLNGAAKTVIDGSGSMRCVYVDGDAVLSGFSLTNGATFALGDETFDQSGGGAFLNSASTLDNCTLSGNTAVGFGGGVYLNGNGTLNSCTVVSNASVGPGGGAALNSDGILNQCALSGNTTFAGDGGGVILLSGGTLNNCSLHDNISHGYGGGAFLNSAGILNNCRLSGNGASYDGGGAFVSSGASLNNCILSRNTSLHDGGGVLLWSGGTLNSCVLSGNIAGNDGGGAGLFSGGILNNCTLSGNVATGRVGGVVLSLGGTLNNCIVWGNESGSSQKDVASFDDDSVIHYTCSSDGVMAGESGCITNNPSFRDEENSDFHLLSDSPCINTGGNAYAPVGVDLDGGSRVMCGAVDMGAYETDYAYADAGQPDESGDGRSWATAKKTIQAAVDLVAAGGTVWVHRGTYDAGAAVAPGESLKNRVCLTKPITVQSLNGIAETIIDGSGSVRCVYLEEGAVLKGFRLIHGSTAASGSGYFDRYGGGAFFNSGGTLDTCTLSDNAAHVYGGGAYLNGGGTLNNCKITDNSSSGPGGGVALTSGAVLNRCVLSGNMAQEDGGGAILLSGGTLNNCFLSSNSSHFYGGGVFLDNSGILNNCTLSGNRASYVGGGALCEDGGILNNCIVWDNEAGSSRNDLSHWGGGATVRYSCSSDGVTAGENGCITDNPLFVNPETGDFNLQQNSPGLNAGSNVYSPTGTDLEGGIRIIGSSVDMGAYEMDYAYVDAARVDDAGDGRSWVTAKKTIQAAVDLVEGGGAVWVRSGTYNAGETVVPNHLATNRVCITKAISVRSLNGAAETIIDGSGSVRVAYLNNGAVLSGFSLMNGTTPVSGDKVFDQSGGGVFLDSSGTLDNCILSGNSAHDSGGGAYLNGDGALNNCSVISNASIGVGGGVVLKNGGLLNNCTVVGNTADGTGGVLLFNGCGVRNSVIWSNHATHSGQDLYNDGGFVFNSCSADGLVHNGNNCMTNNPLFVDVASGDFSLQRTSPCINAGDDTYATSTKDLIGSDRLVSTVDMGAYEFQWFISSPGGVADGGGTLRIASAGLNGSATNVTVCGVEASIIDQGSNWLEVTLPPSPDFYSSVTGGLVVQSSNAPDVVLTPEYTYVRGTHLPFYSDASRTNDLGSGHSWADAKQTIQAAVDASRDGDYILVTNGTYSVGGAVTPGYSLSNRLVIHRAIEVSSVNGPEVTIIQGTVGSNGGNDTNSVRCVYMTASNSSLSGFTLNGGYATSSGNTAHDQSGGGLWLTTGCSVSNCIVKDSAVKWGFGAGVYFAGGGAVTHSTLSGNSNAWSTGGGAYFEAGGSLSHSLVSRNSADSGGGLYFSNGGSADNCLLTTNAAGWSGGGGAFFAGGGQMNNCTLIANTCEWGDGAGAYLAGSGTLLNCIVWSNMSGGMITDIYNGAGTISNSCASIGVTHGTDGCITNHPLFADPSFRLQQFSPCINAGTNSLLSATDLDGHMRIDDGTVDLGAYEASDSGVDQDDDNLTDWQEVHHYRSNRSNPDTDGDAMKDGDEVVAGTDLLNKSSVFTVNCAEIASGEIEFSWFSVSNRRYTLQGRTNLMEGTWIDLPDCSVSAPSNLVRHSGTDGQFFYRLNVREE